MTKEQIGKLIGIVIVFALAVLGVFGYHVTVVQPIQEAVAGLQAAPPLMASRGVTGFDDLSVSSVTTTGGATFAGNVAANGGITVDTSNFAVNGSTGAVSTASTLAVAGAAQFSADVTLPADATGGNAGAKNELSGLPRLKLVALGTMTNGSTETTSYEDDTPDGEFAPIDADVTEALDSTIYRIGSASYKALFAATAAANDGFKRTITSDDLQNNESVGMWLYPSVTIASGDLQILLTDDGGARNVNIGALTANKWNWVEVDISSLDGTTGNAITEFGITLTAQGATNLAAFNLYMDGAWKWDASDEEALGANILADGVLAVMTTATAAGTVNTQAVPAENTDYFIHYETGNDFIVTVTDQSANSGVAVVAY